ncbi:MAG: HprK-related kinase B [Thermodesulfobacteriota bacterium]
MICKERHCNHLVEQLRRLYPVSDRLLLCFGDCIVEVHTNDVDLCKGLAAYFQSFVLASGNPHVSISVHETVAVDIDFPLKPNMPDPGKTRIKEEYADLLDGRIVRKRLTGMVFVFGGDNHLAIGPCRKNLNQVVNFINNRYIAWLLDAGGILAHAAGVIFHGCGIALAGFSGRGKSTLSLHFLNVGADFVSNDRLILKQEKGCLWMHGVAKLPRINPGTILNNPSLHGILSGGDALRYARMAPADLWAVEEKYDVPIERCFPKSRFLLSSPMHALVILNWKLHGGSVRIHRLCLDERRDLLGAFMKSTGLFFLGYKNGSAEEPGEETYLAYLKGIRVFEVTGGVDFHAVLDFFSNLNE